MLGIDEIVGLLIVLFVLFFPVIRMILLKRAEKRRKESLTAERLEEEEAEKAPPILKRRLPSPMPLPKPIVRTEAIERRGKRLRHPLLLDRKNLVIYHEIFGKPKGVE